MRGWRACLWREVLASDCGGKMVHVYPESLDQSAVFEMCLGSVTHEHDRGRRRARDSGVAGKIRRVDKREVNKTQKFAELRRHRVFRVRSLRGH
jgi:hypothetical protein